MGDSMPEIGIVTTGHKHRPRWNIELLYAEREDTTHQTQQRVPEYAPLVDNRPGTKMFRLRTHSLSP